MLNRVSDILAANGPALLQPLAFGEFKGKKLPEVPAQYMTYIAKKLNISPEDLLEKHRIAIALEKDSHSDEVPRNPADLSRINPKLFKHQKQFIKLFGARNYGPILGDVGTGKTYMALEMYRLRALTKDQALVVCPRSVFSSWVRSIENYLPVCTYRILSGTAKDRCAFLTLNRNFFIINYEAILSEKVRLALEAKRFDWIFLDESHKIKSHNARTTKYFLALSAAIPMRWILTGTPITNNEKDLWSQFAFLDRGRTFGISFSKFYKQYFTKGQYGYYGGDFKETQREMLKIKIAEATLGFRVRKEDALDLPSKMYLRREVELTGDALEAYKDMAKNSLMILNDNTILAQHKITQILRLSQITGGGINSTRFKHQNKLDDLEDIILEFRNPVVIVAMYVSEIKAIFERLTKMKKKSAILIGDTKDDERAKLVKDFSEGKKYDAIVLGLAAGATGIDGLQYASSDMIFYSRNYRWDLREQAEGRIHRSGQKRGSTYIDQIAILGDGRSTVDEEIMKALERKDINIKNLIDSVKEILER